MSDTNFNYVGSVDLSNPNPDEDRRDLGQASASDASTSLGTKAVSEATGQAKTGYTNMRGPVTGLPSGLSGCPFTGEIQYHSDGDSSGLQRKERGKQTNYHHTTLDVGLDAFKECKECGMPYNSTRAEDRKAHEDFHKQVVGGVVLKKSSKRPDVTVYSEVIEGVEHRIQALSCKDSPDWRLHFEAALQASYGDLDGPPLDSSVLWSEIQDPQHPQSESLVPRYKVFVYYIAGNIVGVLLAEKVSEAGYFYHGDARYTREGSYDCLVHYNLDEYDRKQQYVYTDETHKVLMCVDRIWVHAEHRFEGIATWLVDIARENFIFNMDIDKKYICFSWPTTMGREFAAKYSEEDDDFKVESARAPIMVKNNRLVDRKEMEEFERRFGMCAK
jgi:N-acetyltransferase